MQIVHVEDDPAQRMLVDGLLSDMGRLVMQAENQADAWGLISSAEEVIVLCDRRLPDGSGVDLLRRLRAEGRQDRFVLLTSALDDAVRAEALAAGADMVLEKAMTLDRFEADLHAVLDGHAAPVEPI